MRGAQLSGLASKAVGRFLHLFPPMKEYGYRHLENFGGYHTTSFTRTGRISKTIGISILLAFVCLLTLSLSETHSSSQELSLEAPGYLHVLIPASHPDPNLCKTVLSAGILGYPSPTLLNWNQTFNDPNLVEGGSHIAKISGIKHYLERFGTGRDSDLVLMVDGYDIWFQLRPQTLIDRFVDINRRANERIRKEIGSRAAVKAGISQNVVFSCQKRCWPWSENDPPCYAVPQSSLPVDIYGKETDTDVGDDQNPYIKYRQRFLNSGVAIGTLGSMRKLFAEALFRAEQDPNFGSDQRIFSQIFGDQEVYREVKRQDTMSWWQSLGIGRESDSRRELFHQDHIDSIRNEDRDLEFNLGVDYESSIGLATVFAEDDTDWLTMSDQSQIREAESARGIAPYDSRLKSLQPDIADTVPPFWTFASKYNLPRDTAWSDVSLFTDVWTGIPPAVIHHNAHRDGLKSLRETWWDRVWYQSHARDLYDAHITAPIGPVAVTHDVKTKSYWSPEDWKGGARDTDGNWLRYEEMCTGTEEEVFRDNQGPWSLPDDA